MTACQLMFMRNIVPESRSDNNRHSEVNLNHYSLMKTTHTPDEREQIGVRIRSVRTERDMTAKELGALVPCSHNTVSDYERGIPVRLVLLRQFADALGVRAEWLETGLGSRDVDPAERPASPQQVIDTEFMHRCTVIAAEWAPAHATPLDRTALACRLYEMFHTDGATDEQLRRFLDRWMAFSSLTRR